MSASRVFLRTKLLPPRSVPETLKRPRLLDRLRANISAPVTVVTADAGCGKTTLIAEFVRSESRPFVWYQLDHTDADPSVFLGYLATAIRDIQPEFGSTFFQYLDEGSEDLAVFPERAVDLLLNEIIEKVEQPFIVVLDDYHHLGRNTLVHKLVDRILQYSSELLHVIMTTRELPPLATMRRRTQSQAMLITRDDLRFTDDEVKALFKKGLDLDLDDSEIAEYGERTHGWITALQLIRQIAEQAAHSGANVKTADLGDILKQSEKDIFDYFAEEVMSRESDETKHLFLYLSLLDAMPLDVCSSLYPSMRCLELLPELATKNVFLTVAGDAASIEEYRFHPLFRDFLRRRLRSEIGPTGVAEERRRIAEHFLATGNLEDSLKYFLDAEAFDQAAEILAEHGSEWIASGKFASLGMYSARIPKTSLEKHPRSLLQMAEVSRLQGDLENSASILQRSISLLDSRNDTSGKAEALHSLASLARRRGESATAHELLNESEKIAAPESETLLKCANTRGLCFVSDGNWTGAEQQFRVALALAEKLGNEKYVRLVTHNLALAPGFRGDFSEALRWFKRIFGDGKPDRQLPQEAIGHLNVARLHLYRGEFAETESHLDSSLELCQLYNLKSLRGEIFEAYANLYREKADRARAGEYYERAHAAYVEAGVDVATRELVEEQAKFYLSYGDNARARGLLENLITSRRGSNKESGIKTAELALCNVDLADRRLEGLAERTSKIQEYFQSHGNYYDEVLAAMLLAETFAALGEVRLIAEPVMRVLDLSARFDYEYWLRQQIAKNPGIFAIEDVFERLPPDLKDLVAAAKTELPAAAIAAPDIVSGAPAAVTFADLTINVLGQVKIFRDIEKPFAADAWTTRRARDILCFIATSRHQRVAKDVLIDTFWPDDDPAVVEKNFHPTISHIRKALNSRQAFKQNFLIFRDGSYQLDPALSYRIDTEDFERAIAEAEIAKREKDNNKLRAALEKANDLYQGDFMEGNYDNWVEDLRHYYQEQYWRVLGALAKLSFAEKRWTAAITFGERILGADPFREDIHRLILKTLAAQGKPAAVQKHFDRMAELMKNELGIAPAAETKNVLKTLLG